MCLLDSNISIYMTLSQSVTFLTFICMPYLNLFILVVKARTHRKAERDKERSYSSRCGRKTRETYSRENLHVRSQVGTENPVHIVPPVGFKPGP